MGQSFFFGAAQPRVRQKKHQREGGGFSFPAIDRMPAPDRSVSRRLERLQCGRQPWLRAWRSASSLRGSPTIKFSMTVRTEAGKADGAAPSPASIAAIAAIRQAPRSRQAIPASALWALLCVVKLPQKTPFLLQKLAPTPPP